MDTARIKKVDKTSSSDTEGLVGLIAAYASDPMGAGKALDDAILEKLKIDIPQQPSLLAFLARKEGQPVGMALCFLGYSTFKAAPIVNVHDLAVLTEHRGQGIGRRLLETVIEYAREQKYAKVTLEVRQDNHKARALYEQLGFGSSDFTDGSPLYFLECPL